MTFQTIPFKSLKLSKANPRKQIDPSKIEGLAASIASDGLLQSLLVRPKGKSSYEIIAGERRYRALQLLHDREVINDDYPVSVLVKADLTKGERHRAATMENVQREALSPIDEADAFAELVGNGVKLDDIAAQTGVPVSTIRRRLAIAGLCAEAKDALRYGQITIGMAEALTLGDQDDQREIIQRVRDGCFGFRTAEGIRRALTEERPTKSMAIFPLEDYTGTFTADLFAEEDETYFDDIGQFRDLQEKAIQKLTDDYAKEYDWVEVIEGSYFDRWRFKEAPEDEKGGVVIHVRPDFRVETHVGITLKCQPETNDEEAPREKPEYSQPARRYMACQRSMAVQASLLSDSRKMMEVMAAMMLSKAGDMQIKTYAPLREAAKADSPARAYQEIEAWAQKLQERLNLDRSVIKYGFKNPDDMSAWQVLSTLSKDPLACYQAVRELDDASLEDLINLLFVLSVGQQDIESRSGADMLIDAVAVDLGISMREWWQPDRDFLSMRTKDQLIDIAHENGAHVGRSLKDATKKKLVDIVAKHFEKAAAVEADNGQLIPEPLQLAREWCPSPMHFGQEEAPEETEDQLAA